jgi:cell division initiation protein
MDDDSPSGSTLDTLRTVEFRLNLKGYNVDEVDEYLEKAAVEAEALHEQLRQMTERVRQASDRIAELEAGRREPAPAPVDREPPVSDDALQRTLLLAQQFVDQTKRQSEAEAADVVAKAEEQARLTVSKAEERARVLTTEAQQHLREEVASLESMRGQLTTDVESMARHLEKERNRLRDALAEMLKWVEENVQPANALMAARQRPADAPRPAAAPARPPEALGSAGAARDPEAEVASAAASSLTKPEGATPPPRKLLPDDGAADEGKGQVLDLRGPTPGDRP